MDEKGSMEEQYKGASLDVLLHLSTVLSLQVTEVARYMAAPLRPRGFLMAAIVCGWSCSLEQEHDMFNCGLTLRVAMNERSVLNRPEACRDEESALRFLVHKYDGSEEEC